ncbi:hypothetical protein BJX61DRAFT_538750 [Aspergillus egyptiacus]|nr:hypothetical protein BJX61DRAFT_538750 [Aspergillus egyptiacus]
MTAQCPQQTDAFRDLYRIFASRDGRILEFEILPPALGPILEDESSIGITKKYLVQAFVTARRVFFDALDSNFEYNRKDHPKTMECRALENELDDKVARASEIILLFDCEHLTACNWRKRRLVALLNSDQTTSVNALNTELSLLTTYLCSPLHRHTKSPTLWQHRQWVQTRLLKIRKPDSHAVQELLRAELSVVLRAGELHPRNYYAFSYMRQMHHILSEFGGDETADGTAQLARSIITPTLDWCLAHPADISGLMFLLYLLDAAPDTTCRLAAVSKVARFALDIGWEGEGIWTFVDLAVRCFSLVDSLRESRGHPWDILLHPDCVDRLPAAGGKPVPPWRAWLSRARAHWAETQ